MDFSFSFRFAYSRERIDFETDQNPKNYISLGILFKHSNLECKLIHREYQRFIM